MTLTPEQKAAGWIEWSGGDCPIKDDRTEHEVMFRNGRIHSGITGWDWGPGKGAHVITAYRIIEAHGADAEPARPTPYPNSYDDLVFDPITGWSQTVVVDGKRPEWLRDDDKCCCYTDNDEGWTGNLFDGTELAIRVRRREPKRETVYGALLSLLNGVDLTVSFDLIDGKPDLSTLKIAEDAL